MVMQPLPLQNLDFSTNRVAANLMPRMPRVKRMEGVCRFDENRCRYTHKIVRDRVESETEGEVSLIQAPTDSAEGSPATQDTTPPQTKVEALVKQSSGRNRESDACCPVAVEPDKTVTLDPPSAFYAAYDPERLPESQVCRVTSSESALNEPVLSSTMKETTSHTDEITCHVDLSKNLSFLLVQNGSTITDEAVINFSFYCNPKVVILNGATSVTDAAFLALGINCGGLEYLEVSGYRNKAGSLTSSCLRMLLESPSVGRSLKEVVVKHQSIPPEAALELSQARKGLAITTGNMLPGAKELDINLWFAGRRAFVNKFPVQ
ncbi:hypothetical protein DRE_07361 [Drechslerella stenobrocha 248]|uniref:Uncharacterized protein n=1 Tax=Drechslerella stenobrocha 248 TaxID=1043628 RepID=W7HV47_9PEZI|nr:hypothetical protein DRE_07361 [Drechslerella stenobrocha 248]